MPMPSEDLAIMDGIAGKPLPNLVDGEFVRSERVLDVVNPATEQPFISVSAAGPEEIERAIAAARRAFDSGVWSEASREHRAAVVRKMLSNLADRREEIVRLLMEETGCPIGSPSMGAQFDGPLQHVRDFVNLYLSLPDEEDAGLPPAARITPAGGVIQSLRRYVPVGVVTAISAYNFPMLINMWKVVPALLAGNSVVLRPNPLTPLAALQVAKAAHDAGVPPGVLNVVVEDTDAGAVKLTTDPRVDMVAFTGSSHVGQLVMAQCAPTMKRLQLELGGKSAQIYLPDRASQAVQAVALSCTMHAGQVCTLGSRVFVPQEMKADILEAMRARIEKIVIGDPRDPATEMGPVMSAAQRARCERYVALAVAAGARVVAGGKRPAHMTRGYYFEPTVLDVPDNANPAAQDEIFGPVISVIGYRTIEEAIQMANDTPFGLSGSVIGGNLQEATAVARRIKTGTINVNGNLMSAWVSSGGWKNSGVGRERGPDGLRIYQNLQVMNVTA